MSGAGVCSVHNHSTLSDGKNTPAQMARAAYEAGVRFFGLSDHSHTSMSYDEGFVLPRDMREYKDAVSALKTEYEGKMEVLCGLEWDSLSDADYEGFDYWIGSVHSLRAPSGRCYGLDSSPESLRECLNEMFRGDAAALAEAYYAEVARVAAQRPTILAHLDIITKFNERESVFCESDPRCRAAALEALRAADPASTLLEINTGAMSRGWRSAPYPEPFLLEEWRSLGGRIIITGDSHSADSVVYGYDIATQAAKAAGFKSVAVLTLGGVREAAPD